MNRPASVVSHLFKPMQGAHKTIEYSVPRELHNAEEGVLER